ncbi:hypothetical protein BG46_01420 [Brucella anthropi]|uniref:hypothetical protein n=1 Tax=Brucella anthropi TaxID=529 RepID=UPI00044C20CA|nr:hypothetical protein [Brucella anthropi]EXL08215.1 hypothetical protein BG46_01420 [Brucella anthropi]
MNPHIKTFVAAGAIGHRRLVKFTGNDGEVALATAATDLLAGVVDFPSGAKAGDRIDVVIFGPAEVVAGGAIAPGISFSAGADGAAVAAAAAGDTTGGFVLTAAASGDFVRAFVQRGSVAA